MKEQMTLEQRRAKYAWMHVQGCDESYANLAKAAPALIMNNGLMQTLAFFNAKKHDAINAHLREWLAYRVTALAGANDFSSLMQKLIDARPAEYRLATDEALLLLRWTRQFASAVARK